MHEQDPRDCPRCGARGKRAYRQPRYDAVGVRWTWVCGRCGARWETRTVALSAREGHG